MCKEGTSLKGFALQTITQLDLGREDAQEAVQEIARIALKQSDGFLTRAAIRDAAATDRAPEALRNEHDVKLHQPHYQGTF